MDEEKDNRSPSIGSEGSSITSVPANHRYHAGAAAAQAAVDAPSSPNRHAGCSANIISIKEQFQKMISTNLYQIPLIISTIMSGLPLFNPDSSNQRTGLIQEDRRQLQFRLPRIMRYADFARCPSLDRCPAANINLPKVLAESASWKNLCELEKLGRFSFVSSINSKHWSSPSLRVPRPASNAGICLHWSKESVLIINGKLVSKEGYQDAFNVLVFDYVTSRCLLDLFHEGYVSHIRRSDLDDQKRTALSLINLKMFAKVRRKFVKLHGVAPESLTYNSVTKLFNHKFELLENPYTTNTFTHDVLEIVSQTCRACIFQKSYKDLIDRFTPSSFQTEMPDDLLRYILNIVQDSVPDELRIPNRQTSDVRSSDTNTIRLLSCSVNSLSQQDASIIGFSQNKFLNDNYLSQMSYPPPPPRPVTPPPPPPVFHPPPVLDLSNHFRPIQPASQVFHNAYVPTRPPPLVPISSLPPTPLPAPQVLHTAPVTGAVGLGGPSNIIFRPYLR